MKRSLRHQDTLSREDQREVEKSVRRWALRPLRRGQRRTNVQAIGQLLSRFDEIPNATEMLPRLAAELRRTKAARGNVATTDPRATRELLRLTRALYAARRISRQEYVFYSTAPVERLHESRVLSGAYAALQEVTQEMETVEERYGLAPNEYWTRDGAPDEYSRLAARWESIYEVTFVQTLRELDLEDLALLRETDRSAFDRLRERGRRAVFHREEVVAILRDIITRYEEDARKAADVAAFSAAITLLGAGLEGLLLLRCLRSEKKCKRIANGLPKRRRPRNSDLPMTWTFQNLIDVCLAAGWLPPLSTPMAQYDSGNLAHVLREMRNHVHPARIAQLRPWSEATQEDYRDAEAIYVTLMSLITGRRNRTPTTTCDVE